MGVSVGVEVAVAVCVGVGVFVAVFVGDAVGLFVRVAVASSLLGEAVSWPDALAQETSVREIIRSRTALRVCVFVPNVGMAAL